MTRAEPPRLAFAVESGAWAVLPEAEALCARAVAEAWNADPLDADEAPDGAEVSLVLADDARVRELNRDWRGKDAPTNVLSFPSLDDAPLPPGEVLLLGDVILAFETVAAEAERDGKELRHHLTHLVVHGMLHLLGHDHETEEEARRMEGLETTILDGMGLPDPWSDDER